MKLIDSHIHFWDPSNLRYRWLDDLPTINKPYLPANLPRTGDGWEMEKLVFVQADCLPEQGLEEVKWVTDLASDDRRIQAIVAYAPLENHNFHAVLEVLRDNPLVKGIRRLIQSEGHGFATQEHFIDAVRNLPDYGFSFDLCALHNQLIDVIHLVEHCPDVSFVLDHVGKPDIKQGDISMWKSNITRLAEFDHVHCKLSGMVTEADLDNWTPEDLQPYIDHVLEAFTPARVMFGGDYPVLELAHTTYDKWVQTALNALTSLSDDEKKQVFYNNANTFYRL